MGFDNVGFFPEGNLFRVKPLETTGVIVLCSWALQAQSRYNAFAGATIYRGTIA